MTTESFKIELIEIARNLNNILSKLENLKEDVDTEAEELSEEETPSIKQFFEDASGQIKRATNNISEAISNLEWES